MNTENENKAYLNSPRAAQRILAKTRGYRYLNIPGVIYPEDAIEVKPGYCPRTGKPYTSAPKWGISTEEASKMLHCTPSAARIHLHKCKIRFHWVQANGKARKIYWDRAQVIQLASENVPISHTRKKGLLNSAEAMRLLGISRTSLIRYSNRGLLSILVRRVPSRCGLRTSHLFLQEELEKLRRAREEWEKCGNVTLPLEHFLEPKRKPSTR
ncbi:MAG: hypothetical protein IJB31_03265 [Akkermansia sp.]|nr:hypothetical protein [Akkermansia sp.]